MRQLTVFLRAAWHNLQKAAFEVYLNNATKIARGEITPEEVIREMLDTDGPFLLEACVIEEGNVLPMTPPGSSVNYMMLDLDC